MSEWVVRFCFDTGVLLNSVTLDKLAEAAEARDATVSNWPDGPGLSVTVGVEAEDVVGAAQDGVRFVRDELGADTLGKMVHLRVTTPKQFEAEALQPDFPPLASAADAAEILGVSRQRVHQLAASNTRFPAPVARVGAGPLWTVPAIEHFNEIWDRRRGRRPDAKVQLIDCSARHGDGLPAEEDPAEEDAEGLHWEYRQG